MNYDSEQMKFMDIFCCLCRRRRCRWYCCWHKWTNTIYERLRSKVRYLENEKNTLGFLLGHYICTFYSFANLSSNKWFLDLTLSVVRHRARTKTNNFIYFWCSIRANSLRTRPRLTNGEVENLKGNKVSENNKNRTESDRQRNKYQINMMTNTMGKYSCRKDL